MSDHEEDKRRHMIDLHNKSWSHSEVALEMLLMIQPSIHSGISIPNNVVFQNNCP